MDRTIITPRLLLRPLEEKDAADVFEWASAPDVNRYMPYPLHQSIQDTREWLRSVRPENNEFAFVIRETGKVIGSGNIRHMEDGRYAVGYNLNSAYWGKGYATEAARGMIRWAYDVLGARDFFAQHATANTASGSVLRKCGFQFDQYGQYSRMDGSETFDAVLLKMHMD